MLPIWGRASGACGGFLKRCVSFPWQPSTHKSSSAGVEARGPLPFSCWHSDWLILYRSCAGHHSGGEFMGAVPFLNPLSNPLSNVFIFGKVLRILGCTIKYWPQLAFLSLLCVLVFARTSKNNINEGIILSHSVTCLSVVVLRRAWQSRAAHMGDVRQRIEKRPGHGRASNMFL